MCVRVFAFVSSPVHINRSRQPFTSTVRAELIDQVNDFYQTSNPRVYACGDVIGYPALASTSMEQVRNDGVLI